MTSPTKHRQIPIISLARRAVLLSLGRLSRRSLDRLGLDPGNPALMGRGTRVDRVGVDWLVRALVLAQAFALCGDQEAGEDCGQGE